MAKYTQGNQTFEEKLRADIIDTLYNCGCSVNSAPIANALLKLPTLAAAAQMYEALKSIMSLDTSGSLAAAAYTGGDIPKKWIREVAPAIDARANARKEIQEAKTGLIMKNERGEQIVSADGEPMTVDYCQCCGEKQPNGTLYIVGFRSRCSKCLLHIAEGKCRSENSN